MNMWRGLIHKRLIHKTVSFKFRGMDLNFDLSQELFSSADIDSGTRFLLKVFSKKIDAITQTQTDQLPGTILDAGCGIGVIGICTAAAIDAMGGGEGLLVNCHDRDELARLFTLHNAAKNNISPAVLKAYTCPLLAEETLGFGYDMILSNIPAKAGHPVLEDFFCRSLKLLNPEGLVIIVAVNTLYNFCVKNIEQCGAEIFLEEKSPGHTVFVFGFCEKNKITQSRLPSEHRNRESGFLAKYPFYFRSKAVYEMEGQIVSLETLHGAPGFDKPGGSVLAAAKLARRIDNYNSTPSLLVFEPEQGFFPCWLLKYLKGVKLLVLSGRNILALEASKHNVLQKDETKELPVHFIPAVDLSLGCEALLSVTNGRKFDIIAAFPQKLHKKDDFSTIWDALPSLLADKGILLAAFSSTDALRFHQKKPSGFTSLGSVKKNGFRALAYLK